jgi:hypothetical protein
VKCWPINLSGKYEMGPFIDRKELNKIKEDKKPIFICSCNDLFANDVPQDIIITILNKCGEFRSNEYLFQTKNPRRLSPYVAFWIPPNSTVGTTIESNRDYGLSEAPSPVERYGAMVRLPRIHDKMVSIEPIMDFDIETMVRWMRLIRPTYISIGADSKNKNLPEPSPEKIKALVDVLQTFTEVRIKDNLKRLMNVRKE